MKPVVVYIIGAGNSGTTLLSMILGAHNQMFSVGELSHIDRYVAFDMTCSCSQKFSRCHFWNQIDLQNDPPCPINPMNTVFNLFRYRNDCLRRDPHCLHVLRRNIELYKQIHAVSGKKVIVDASKNPLRLYYLARSGQVRLFPIHLVRDGRAYIDSAKRRGRSILPSLFRWVRMNLIAENVFKRIRAGERGMKLNYSIFIQNPERFLKEICRHLELEYDSNMLEYHKNTFHNLSGMRTRFQLKPIDPYEKWQDRLPLIEKILFTLFGGHFFNRYFGASADKR